MSLQIELAKPEYQVGTYAERYALLMSKTEQVYGRIQQDNLKVVEAMIVKGMWRSRMETLKNSAESVIANVTSTEVEKSQAKIVLQVVAGFHESISEAKMANKADPALGGHSINLGDALVMQTFQAASLPFVQMLTPEETVELLQLATYIRQIWKGTALKDVVAFFEPALTDLGDWSELNYIGGKLSLNLLQSTPELTMIRIEVSESIDGQTWTEWRRVAHFYNVHQAGLYLIEIPYTQFQRKIRWRGEDYKIIGSMAGV